MSPLGPLVGAAARPDGPGVGPGGPGSRVGLAGQVLLLLAAWTFAWTLHRGNDGLWYQGDAPRHAANGLFWRAFLARRPSAPRSFALDYYARYPVIAPTTHPPVFYLLEGAAFTIFGASPYVAKGLVLGFALMAAAYATAWLRRWVAEEAGLAGSLVPLLPGVVCWSNAVMLNVPSFALGLGALYHGRRALEAPAWRHFAAACVLGLAAFLTYYTAGVVFLIALAWALALPGRRLGFRKHRAAALLVCLLLPAVAAFSVRWAPSHVYLALSLGDRFWTASNWTYYPARLPELFGTLQLALAGAGFAVGVSTRVWRRETAVLGVWAVVMYVVFSFIRAREPRYILLMGIPVIGLGSIAVLSAVRQAGVLAGWPGGRVKAAAGTVFGLLTLVQAGTAATTRVPAVEGFREVAAFLERVAPDDSYFYDGPCDGVFTFYVQAGDPGYRRRVAVGHKLLYSYAMDTLWRLRQYVSSPADVVEVLQSRGGCRWLVIAVQDGGAPVEAARHLRRAVEGPEFEPVRSFPVVGPGVRRLDVYRLRGPIRPVVEVDLPFPILGDGVHFKARPVRPGEKSGRGL